MTQANQEQHRPSVEKLLADILKELKKLTTKDAEPTR